MGVVKKTAKKAAPPVKKAVATPVKKTVAAPVKITAPVKKSVVAPVKKTKHEDENFVGVRILNDHVRVQTAEGRKRDQKRELLEMRKRKWSEAL